jgi:hypothetical protein
MMMMRMAVMKNGYAKMVGLDCMEDHQQEPRSTSSNIHFLVVVAYTT